MSNFAHTVKFLIPATYIEKLTYSAKEASSKLNVFVIVCSHKYAKPITGLALRSCSAAGLDAASRRLFQVLSACGVLSGSDMFGNKISEATY